MQSHRFDAVVRALAAPRSRRAAARAGALAGTASTPLAATSAQEATPVSNPTEPHPSADAPARVEYLFVQPFEGGTWKPKEGEDGVYTLTLSGAPAQTVYFSDRPAREFGLGPTQRFLDRLGFTPANPPNAALVTRAENDAAEEVVVVELLSPAHDSASGTLTYEARVLADYAGDGLAYAARRQSDYDLSEQLAPGGLFIDSGPECGESCATCYQVINGTQQTVGLIHNIGMCAHDTSVFGVCKPCNDDGTSQYYGGLCSDAYPSHCSHTCNATGCTWDCYATMLDNCEPSD